MGLGACEANNTMEGETRYAGYVMISEFTISAVSNNNFTAAQVQTILCQARLHGMKTSVQKSDLQMLVSFSCRSRMSTSDSVSLDCSKGGWRKFEQMTTK